MKYAIRFYNGCRVLNRASEIILRYDEIHHKLVSYVDEYTQGQRIVLDITGYDSETILEDNLNIWKQTKEKHRKLAVKLNESQIYLMEDLHKAEIDYFLDTKVDTLDKLYALSILGVSDVYICNELGFNLKDISKYCRNRNINIRVYPNIAQSSCEQFEIDNFKKFFIRPEDVYLYENYIDIFEFYTDRLDKQSVLYDIYKDEKWLGDLSQLILGLQENIVNTAILPDFAEARIGCRKRCVLEQCGICDRIKDFLQIADKIKEQSGQEIEIRRDKKNDENKFRQNEESNDS